MSKLTKRERIQQIARRYKSQYCKYGKWRVYEDWQIQPEDIYLIMKQLRNFRSIDALVCNGSWTKHARRLHRKESNPQSSREESL